MAWDTEATKAKILDAAVAEFAAHGPDGTTVDRISRRAGVNKERIYNYYGGKQKLFARVLWVELERVAADLPVDVDDLGEFAGRTYDYHRSHPQLSRLLRWEGLAVDTLFADGVPDEEGRTAHYRAKVDALAAGQRAGKVTDAVDADHLMFLVLSLAGWWATVPQVAKMITGAEETDGAEDSRRRASVVEAVRRMAVPTGLPTGRN